MSSSLRDSLRRGVRNPAEIPKSAANAVVNTLANEIKKRSETGYRLTLKLRDADLNPREPTPNDVDRSATLKTKAEYESAIDELRTLGLPLHPDDPKNWDGLLALKSVLAKTTRNDAILVLAPVYQPFVEWLYLYGYENLVDCNVTLEGDFEHGPITYLNRDPTNTPFEPESFDAVVALSLLDDGFDGESLVSEAYRVLKPGGQLIVSGDYWPDGVKESLLPNGSREDWNIYDEESMRNLLDYANQLGFDVPDDVDYAADEAVVSYHGERFTFIYLELNKP